MIDQKEGKILQEFGKKLEKLRKSKDFSYRKLAMEADLAVSYIQKLEAGISNPSYTTLLKLADALDANLNEFTLKK